MTNAQLKTNTAKLTEPVPPHLPVAIIFKQVEDCQQFAMAGGILFTPAQIIKAAEVLILSTGKYHIAYIEWNDLLKATKKYNNFKQRFIHEYQLQNKIKATTSTQAGYHKANFVNNTSNSTNINLEEAVQNFTKASAADCDRF